MHGAIMTLTRANKERNMNDEKKALARAELIFQLMKDTALNHWTRNAEIKIDVLQDMGFITGELFIPDLNTRLAQETVAAYIRYKRNVIFLGEMLLAFPSRNQETCFIKRIPILKFLARGRNFHYNEYATAVSLNRWYQEDEHDLASRTKARVKKS